MRVYLNNRKDIYVFRDGKALDILTDRGREYVEFDVQEGQEYSLEFVKKSEFSRPFWFVYAIVFWIVGIMGFFTPKFSKNTFALNCRLTAVASSRPLELAFSISNPKYAPSVAVKISGDSQGIALENEKYAEDKKAKSRRRIYSLISAILRIVFIVGVAVVIIKKIIG